jgi:hypothetical protein
MAIFILINGQINLNSITLKQTKQNYAILKITSINCNNNTSHAKISNKNNEF